MIHSIITRLKNLDGDRLLKDNIDLILITTIVIIDWGAFRAIIHFTAESPLYNVMGIHYTSFSPEINLYEFKKLSILKSILLYMAIFIIAKRLPRDG